VAANGERRGRHVASHFDEEKDEDEGIYTDFSIKKK
jgi:hypothetical protein